MRGRVFSLLGALVAAAAPSSGAQNVPLVEVGPAVFRSVAPRRAPASSGDLALAAGRLPDAARHALGPLTAAERAELRTPDSRGGVRRKMPALKVGVSRPLPSSVGFDGVSPDLGPGQSRAVAGGLLERGADGRWTWTASFSSAGAAALRLFIPRAKLPAGSRVFVYGPDGQVQGPYGFDSGSRPEGFWTNTVFGDRIFLEAQLPAASDAALAKAVLRVGAVVHIELPEAASAGLRPKSQTCFIDRSCVTPSDFPDVDDATRAVGQLNFVDGGKSYVCTGGLMNTVGGVPVPYLLTANHCFSTQASATSLEVFWQYRTATCDGVHPDESQFPHTLGSTLLATGTTSDFTLVQLSQDPPDDSVQLGWTTADLSHAGGTMLYRLSYSGVNPMVYTREQISATPTPVSCSDATQGDFIYEKDVAGGTGGGSSGSPIYLEGLRVVGQESRQLRHQHGRRLRRHEQLDARRGVSRHLSVRAAVARAACSGRLRRECHDPVPELGPVPRDGSLGDAIRRERRGHGRSADQRFGLFLVLRREQHRARREGPERMRPAVAPLLGLRGRPDQRRRHPDRRRHRDRRDAVLQQPDRDALLTPSGHPGVFLSVAR